MKTKLVLSILSFILSFGFLLIGFYKLLFYDEWTNRVVGGDAYNFIINSNVSIAFFVLASLFSIIGLLLLIWRSIKPNNHESQN